MLVVHLHHVVQIAPAVYRKRRVEGAVSGLVFMAGYGHMVSDRLGPALWPPVGNGVAVGRGILVVTKTLHHARQQLNILKCLKQDKNKKSINQSKIKTNLRGTPRPRGIAEVGIIGTYTSGGHHLVQERL
jgi:hypothetical protein